MRWKWHDAYLPQGLQNIYCLSLSPTPIPQYLCTPAVTPHGCTWRPWSRDCGDALGDRSRVNPEMNLQTVIEFGDVLGYHNRASLEIHLEALIEWTQICAWRQWSSEMHLESVIEPVERYSCMPWMIKIGAILWGGRSGGRRDGNWDSIYWLTRNGGDVESSVQQYPPRDEKLAGSRILSNLGWCSTWCMLYSVLTHDHGMET